LIARPLPSRSLDSPRPVSASALAQHLDCGRTGKLEIEGVIQRQGDRFGGWNEVSRLHSGAWCCGGVALQRGKLGQHV
jgi:hypothetical protein